MNALFITRLSLIILFVCSTPRWPGSATFAQTPGTVRITQQQLAEFTSTVERAVKTNDAALLQGLIDWDTIKDQVAANIELHPELREKFWTRAESSFASAWVFELHMESYRGDFAFRRLLHRNGRTQAIFRCIFSTGDSCYPILTVAPSASGTLMIVNIERPMAGISAVRDWRSSFILMSKSLGDSVGNVPTPTQSEFIRQNEKFSSLEQLIVAGDGHTALNVYASLTPEFQRDFRAKAWRLQAAIMLGVGGPEHREAVRDLLNVTQDPLTRSFVLMVYHLGVGDINAAAGERRRVKQFLGIDGWLDCVFATACLIHNELDVGRSYAESAVKTEPDLANTHMVLMAVAAAQGDYRPAASALKRLDEIKPLPNTVALESKPELKQFVLSQPYLQWKEMRFKDALERERRVAREAKAFFESLESK